MVLMNIGKNKGICGNHVIQFKNIFF